MRTQSGAVLPVTLAILAATTMLGIGALRAATELARLGTALIAARGAFTGAELGLAAGLDIAANRPAELPVTAALSLPALSLPAGRVEVTLLPVATDTDCPALAPSAAERSNYEIHATAFAGQAAVTTHVLGFHLCRELCTNPGCIAVESAPAFGYWLARPGRREVVNGS